MEKLISIMEFVKANIEDTERSARPKVHYWIMIQVKLFHFKAIMIQSQ